MSICDQSAESRLEITEITLLVCEGAVWFENITAHLPAEVRNKVAETRRGESEGGPSSFLRS